MVGARRGSDFCRAPSKLICGPGFLNMAHADGPDPGAACCKCAMPSPGFAGRPVHECVQLREGLRDLAMRHPPLEFRIKSGSFAFVNVKVLGCLPCYEG